MLKKFITNVRLDGSYTAEDPKCPSYWKGSGCYDVTMDAWCDTEVEVWAETEDKARQFALDYDYGSPYAITEVDSVHVESIAFVEDLPDRDLEEAGVIEPVEVKWRTADTQ